MTKKCFVLQMGAMLWILGSGLKFFQAQQQAPDTILYNGKIVTMSVHGVNENVGTIAQAFRV